MNNQEEERISQVQQIKGKEKAQSRVNPNQMDQDDSSEWSLDSLEDIKGINIHELEQEENNRESRQQQKPMLEAKFPEKPSFLSTAALHEIGKVIFVVGELLIVQANNGSFVVDLDNWVSDENKNLIGFVIDVLGKIETPYYAIKPEHIPESTWLGRRLFYIEGTSKILRDDDIKSMQSKSAAEVLEEVEDSSDQEIEAIPQRKYSEERRQRRREAGFRRNQRWREDQMRQESRDRTRERQHQNRHPSRARNQHNQRYLQTMYNMHYNQMMHLYNGTYNPNTMPNFLPSSIPTPPQNFNHANVANFGSNQITQPQFYGQNPQAAYSQGINFQANQSWQSQKPEDQRQNNLGPKRQ